VADTPEKWNGDELGAAVDVHAPGGLEVEFVVTSGSTQGVVTLRSA